MIFKPEVGEMSLLAPGRLAASNVNRQVGSPCTNKARCCAFRPGVPLHSGASGTQGNTVPGLAGPVEAATPGPALPPHNLGPHPPRLLSVLAQKVGGAAALALAP